MAAIRMTGAHHDELVHHLLGRRGEHFAFLLCSVSTSGGEPVFLVRDVIVIPDSDLTATTTGWVLGDQALDGVVNAAIRSGAAIVECHNHGGDLPRFSKTDRAGLPAMARYIGDTLAAPYAATVWGDEFVHGEWFTTDATGPIRSITAIGDDLRQLVSGDDDVAALDPVFDRQVPWFTAAGQRRLGRLRVGIVGLSGTGSHVALETVHLGVRDFVLVDPDLIERINLNRVVTADATEVDDAKVFAARRRIRSLAPDAQVLALPQDVLDVEVLDALRGVDVLFGCVDNDGARLVLNRFAVAYGIPYIDIATGIHVKADGAVTVTAAGGRVIVVRPGGPCMECIGEIDHDEARYFLGTDAERADQRRLGYATGLEETHPSVVSLNGIASSIAVTEFAVLVSGLRRVATHIDIDVLGVGREPATWTAPVTHRQREGCFECGFAWTGDRAAVEALAPRPAIRLAGDRHQLRREASPLPDALSQGPPARRRRAP